MKEGSDFTWRGGGNKCASEKKDSGHLMEILAAHRWGPPLYGGPQRMDLMGCVSEGHAGKKRSEVPYGKKLSIYAIVRRKKTT